MIESEKQELVDTLMKAATEDLGFSQGKPVATYIIYKSILHNKAFEAYITTIFDRIVQMMGSTTEVASLFDDHPDLLDEFARFFPEASASASAYQALLQNSYQHYDERSSVVVPLRPGVQDIWMSNGDGEIELLHHMLNET